MKQATPAPHYVSGAELAKAALRRPRLLTESELVDAAMAQHAIMQQCRLAIVLAGDVGKLEAEVGRLREALARATGSLDSGKGDPNWPLPSFDARDWAKSFMDRFGNRLGDINEGLMLTWFASALMRGYDEHAHRSAASGNLPENTGGSEDD